MTGGHPVHPISSVGAATTAGFAQRQVPPITDTAQTTAECPLVRSAFAGHRDLEGFADLAHSLIAESAEALDERSERDTFNRVEIHD